MSKIIVTLVVLTFFAGIAVLVKFNINKSESIDSEPLRSEASTVPNPTPTPVEDVDIKASFAIYTNGTFRIFTASMYHNLSKDVFIDKSNPNVLQVRKNDTTWSDFFATLPFSLTENCLITGTRETFCDKQGGQLRFFINGELSNNALSSKIQQGDKLLVTFGNESNEVIKQQIQSIP